jgi:hypothetical protein
MCSAVLTFEAILVGLSIPLMITMSEVPAARAGWLGGSLAAACLLTVGLLRRSWGYAVGHVLQVAILALGFVVPAMFFVGALFAALWLAAYVLGARIEADRRRRVDPIR